MCLDSFSFSGIFSVCHGFAMVAVSGLEVVSSGAYVRLCFVVVVCCDLGLVNNIRTQAIYIYTKTIQIMIILFLSILKERKNFKKLRNSLEKSSARGSARCLTVNGKNFFFVALEGRLQLGSKQQFMPFS